GVAVRPRRLTSASTEVTTCVSPSACRRGSSSQRGLCYWRASCSLTYADGGGMHVEDLDISPSKIGETAQRIVDRAIEESRRREHALLTNEHLFLAFSQVARDMFAVVMLDFELNPHAILQPIGVHLHNMPSVAGLELRVS